MKTKLLLLVTISLSYLALGCDSEIFPDLNPDSSSSSDEYVDLGLSVKWATCNLGASKPEETGLYYQWGDTKGYGSDTSDGKFFESEDLKGNITYKWCSNEKHPYLNLNKLTKYNTVPDFGPVDNKTVLDPEDDAAHAALGGKWRMPTDAEWKELIENCTWNCISIDGFDIYAVASKKPGYTERYIILPAAGKRSGGSLELAGSLGNYWSSSLDTDSPGGACTVYFYYFYSSRVDCYTDSRAIGLPIRPVLE